MPKLNLRPPEFEPKGRYTQERKEAMDKVHAGDFLLPEERKLIHHLISEQNEAFAWDDTERRRFREDMFPRGGNACYRTRTLGTEEHTNPTGFI